MPDGEVDSAGRLESAARTRFPRRSHLDPKEHVWLARNEPRRARALCRPPREWLSKARLMSAARFNRKPKWATPPGLPACLGLRSKTRHIAAAWRLRLNEIALHVDGHDPDDGLVEAERFLRVAHGQRHMRQAVCVHRHFVCFTRTSRLGRSGL